jgi:hypothetical protein
LRTVFSFCSTTAYNLNVLQHLLLSCGSKRKSSKSSSSSSTTSSKPVAMKAFSLFRKLNVSEVPLKKKSLTGKVKVVEPPVTKNACSPSSVSFCPIRIPMTVLSLLFHSTWMTCQSLPPARGAGRVAWCQGTLSPLLGAPGGGRGRK